VMDAVQRDVYGNPSSVHAEGSRARVEIDRARDRVSSLLGVDPADVLFTSGATEANNTALLGLLARRTDTRRHIVATNIEHPSVDAPLEVLASAGYSITRVPVNAEGRVDVDAVAGALTDETALVTVIWANNETGVIQPVAEIAALARERGAWTHSDATQAVGKVPVELAGIPLDLLSLSAHKLGGPKGVGCLLVRGGLDFEPILHGGPQERRRRGGTENVAGVAGLGMACDLAERELAGRGEWYAGLRDRLWQGIREKVAGVRRNGSAEHVLPNTLNVEFEATAGELLLQALDLEGIAVSSGAACASGSIEPSHVLTAMGRSVEAARGSLRFSVGYGVDGPQIERVLACLPDFVERVRRAGAT